MRGRGDRAGGPASRRRRAGRAAWLSIDQLETRTLLSASPIMGPMPSSSPAPAPSQETFNLQLQPGSSGAISALMPTIAAQGGSVQATTISGLYTVQVPTADATPLAAALSASPIVAYASESMTVQELTVPNDPDYTNGDEWQLNGTWGIDAPAAWSVTTGSDSVIVADTDTGLNYNLGDMIDNVWLNQAEIPASVYPDLTDVDDDGIISFGDLNNPVNQGPGKITPIADSSDNGAVVVDGSAVLAPTSAGGWASGSTQDGDTSNPDDLIGWNFASISTSDPNGTNTPTDGNGHGTFTASEIGEVGNNATQGTGVDWNVQIMPVEILDSSGNGTDTAAAEGIEYAVDHGAKVINASWGSTGTDPTIAAAIQYADNAGVIIVAAAGNDGTDDDTTPFVPASYSADYSNVISVAATYDNGALASFSNYGVGTVQIAAPGNEVYGLSNDGSYVTDSGTSQAAPLVTGTIALVEAAHPTWTMSQVIDAVLDTVTPDSHLTGKVTSGGIVNAAMAVANTDGPYVTAATPDGSIGGGSGLSSVQVTFNEEINPATFTASQVTLDGPGGAIEGVSVAPVAGSNDHEFTISFPAQTASGAYTLTVGPDVQDWYGNDMNQDREGVNGQADDAFVETIRQALPGSADVLSITGIPSTVTAGTSYTFTVTALSPSGGTDTGYMGTVDFSSTDPDAVLPAAYPFTTSDDGTFTFKVTFKTAGAEQSITATDSANPAIAGTEQNIIVQAASPVSLKVTGFPTPDTAGAPETVTVTAYDTYGNVATGYTGTLQFSSTDPEAVLPANVAITPDEMGTATFTATLETAGTQSITATDTNTSSLTASETSIDVQAAAAASLTVAGFPTTDTAGAANDVTVTAYDPYGNVATGYAGTVDLTSSDGQPVLPAGVTFTAADAGTLTFAATLDTAGTQSLIATDATLTGSESGIVVQAAALQGFQVTGFPTLDAAGVSGSFVVSAVDAYGNVIVGYTGPVDFSSTDPRAAFLPAPYTFVAGDDGKHTFTATLDTAGTQSITATDANNSTITGSETGIVVQAAAASSLTVTGPSGPATAGTAFDFTVTAYDSYGNVATGYTGTVDFSGTDPRAAFQPAPYTFVPGDDGEHTFTATLYTAGTQTITATDSTDDLKASESNIAVQAATASSLAITGFPATDTAGVAQDVSVTAYDAYGNVATGYTGTVVLTSSDGQAVLPGPYAFTAADAGTHTFSVTLDIAGTQSIQAGDTTIGTLAASETGIVVSPAVASELVFGQQPTGTTAGVAIGPAVTVEVEDNEHNLETGDGSTVTLTLLGGTFEGGASTATAVASGGVATFTGLKIDAAGTYTVSASDGSLTPSGASDRFTISPAAADRLVMLTQPSSTATAGQAFGFQPVIEEEDQYGNRESSDDSTVVTATVAAGTASLTGTVTATVSGGVAAFTSLAEDIAGTFSIAFQSSNLNPATANPTTVSPAAATQLVVTSQPPSSLTAGQTFTMVVSAEDPFGNVDPTFNGDVTLSVASDPGFTATVQASNGVAAFAGLALDASANGGTIQASASGLSAATTIPVSVARIVPPTPPPPPTPTTPTPTSSNTPTPPPTIIGERVVTTRKTNKKGKPVGKPVIVGFALEYSTAMDPATAGLAANYQVDTTAKKHGKKKSVARLQPVAFAAAYDSSTFTVTLSIQGKQKFANGGQVSITGGVTSTSDVPVVASDTEFTILPRAKGIVPG